MPKRGQRLMRRLTVSYPLSFYMDSNLGVSDKHVFDLLGKDRCGASGAGLGFRDLDFYYPSADDFQDAKRILKRRGKSLPFPIEVSDLSFYE